MNEKIRFLSVGAINTLIDFGILFLLVHASIPVVASNIISTSAALAFSFFANRNFTFKAGGKPHLRQIVIFLLVTLFGLWVLQSLAILVTQILLSRLAPSLSLLAGKLIATVITLVWNYLWYSRVVFKK